MRKSRRQFLQQSLAAGIVAGSVTFNKPAKVRAASVNEKLVVGVMGLGRGKGLINSFAPSANARVEYVCDVDSRRLAEGASLVTKLGGNDPQQVVDVRKILDDKRVDALVIAAPVAGMCSRPSTTGLKISFSQGPRMMYFSTQYSIRHLTVLRGRPPDRSVTNHPRA